MHGALFKARLWDTALSVPWISVISGCLPQDLLFSVWWWLQQHAAWEKGMYALGNLQHSSPWLAQSATCPSLVNLGGPQGEGSYGWLTTMFVSVSDTV